MTRQTRKIARQINKAQAPADLIDIIDRIDSLPASPELTELRNQAIVTKTNLVQASIAVLHEGRNARRAR